MFSLLPLLNFLALSCTEPKVPADEGVTSGDNEADEVVEVCSSGSYPGVLQLWHERNENDDAEYLEEPAPNCETEIEIELIDEGGMTSLGECTTANGRLLLFEFSGISDEPNLFSGQVYLTKPNGQQQEGTFDGSCTQNEADTFLSFEWFMTVSTPHGEIEHHGILTSPTIATD